MSKFKFTIKDALTIQSDCLRKWKPRLSRKCYADLMDHITTKNSEILDNCKLRNGYAIPTNGKIETFIRNWKPSE
jgi:hypothetical protein